MIPRDSHAMFFATLAVVAAGIERLATEIKAVGPWSDTPEGKRVQAFAQDAVRTADLILARAEGRS